MSLHTADVLRWREELGEPAASPESRTYRDRVLAIYQAYAPARAALADGALQAYRGREERLIRTLVRKYGPEPPTPSAAAHAAAAYAVAPVTTPPATVAAADIAARRWRPMFAALGVVLFLFAVTTVLSVPKVAATANGAPSTRGVDFEFELAT